MEHFTYDVGLDVHRLTLAYCVKTAAGEIVKEGMIEARRAVMKGMGRELGERLGMRAGSDHL